MIFFASKTDEITKREIDNAELARELGSECVVLLKNDGALPLPKNGTFVQTAALFGSGARRTVKGGTGSGDVNSRSVTNVEQGLEEAGIKISTKNWLDKNEEAYKQAKIDYKNWVEEESKRIGKHPINVIFDYPFVVPQDIKIEEEDIKAAKTDENGNAVTTALYVIARISGEAADRKNVKGDYELYENEAANIALLQKTFEKVVVVLNAGGIVDLKPVQTVNAIVLMSQLGNLGGKVLADVITGKTTPSGHLSDTWALNYMDYPSSAEFSFNNGNVHEDFYKDGIYVGYRYFDTFHKEVLYPFGFGLSYTTFDLEAVDAVRKGNVIELKVQVKNTGCEYCGKETVQVYVSGSSDELEKPYQELKAFEKSKLLKPGESEIVTVSFNLESLASYDEKSASWIIEKGSYIVRVGNNSRSTKAAAEIVFEKAAVTEVCFNAMPLDCKMEMLNAAAASCDAEAAPCTAAASPCTAAAPKWTFTIPEGLIETKKNVYKERQELTTDVQEKITMEDVLEGKYPLEDLAAQLTVEEMAALCVGQISQGPGSVIGQASALAPGAAGDSSNVLKESRKVRGLIMADGPAGLRLQPHFKADKDGKLLPGGEIFGETTSGFENVPEGAVDYYQYCTAIPIGWALAQSWNCQLVEKIGRMIGGEMQLFGIDYWLAPALNIHRNPLCGRNFEYFSEDPFLSGKMAAAMTNGVQSVAGKGTTIKHFAANNQEENRYFTNAHISERALREIYLKGFEIAVKESQPMALMTSYNLINGLHTPNHRDLCQKILREEWGFVGMVMTDWMTTQDFGGLMSKYEHHYPISSSAGCIYAGNEVQMPGCQQNITDIIEAVLTGQEKDGFKITKADLQYCALNELRAVLRVMAAEQK